MSQQNQTTFTLRIASNDTASYGEGTSSCRATADSDGATINLADAYRNSRQNVQYTLSSMRNRSIGRFTSSAAFIRRAA